MAAFCALSCTGRMQVPQLLLEPRESRRCVCFGRLPQEPERVSASYGYSALQLGITIPAFAALVATRRRWRHLRIVRFANGTSSGSHCFEVEALEGRGFGAVAARDIAPGELVLSEAPLVTCQPGDWDAVQAQVSALSEDGQEAFFSLHDAYVPDGEPKTLPGIINTNSALVSLSDDTSLVVVCKTLSRFNHSCTPNCEPVYAESIGAQQIYASTSIPAGEELFLSYIDVRAPRAHRQQELSQGYKFQCLCRACVEGDARSDDQRTRMLQLHPDLGDRTNYKDSAKGIRSLTTLMRLYDEEGIHNQAFRRRACDTLFELCKSVKDETTALRWVERACEHAKLGQGLDHENTQSLVEKARDFRSSLGDSAPPREKFVQKALRKKQKVSKSRGFGA